MAFANVYIHFRMWTGIRNPRVTDPDKDVTKVRDPCESGSTTLNVGIGIDSGLWVELGSGF
jgi:hypothetical protein